jgi:hypothetical protein
LNKGEIPSTGSLVEVFNKGILERCLKLYNKRMEGVGLPVSVDKLQHVHVLAEDEARKLFDKQHFGKHYAAQSFLNLDEEIKKVLLTEFNYSFRITYDPCSDNQMDSHIYIFSWCVLKISGTNLNLTLMLWYSH